MSERSSFSRVSGRDLSLIIHRGVYMLKLLITGVTQAIVPVFWFAARSVASQERCSADLL
jgi:hypothetical protein